MQHNLRDPMRDHDYGRIYRISAEGRPLQEPVAIHNQPVSDLLALLEHPVNTVRHRVRVELSGRETGEVIAAVQQWSQQFDAGSEAGAHALVEALWVHQQHNVVNRALLDQLLASPNEDARFAAQRVAWFWDGRESDVVAAGTGEHGHHDHEEADEGQGAALDLTGEEVAELTITAVVEQMRYDVTEFTVRAGQPVVLHFKNPDFMPHNLMIVEPGQADQVGRDAIDLGAEGFAKQFIPDNASILHTTQMLNVDESETLEFEAPGEAGAYEFVCTFPGHHTLMRGIMRVVE